MWLDEKVARYSISKPRFMICYESGHVILLALPSPPLLLNTLLNQEKFLNNTGAHKSILSFTSMGGTIDHSIMDTDGRYSFIISGKNYYRMGSLLPA